MSITGAASNALSGLTASARAVEVISDNVANAMTDGYGRREVVLTSYSLAGQGVGVRVAGIARFVDQTAIAERRLAQASLGAAEAESGFLARMEQTIGQVGDPGSLTARISAFEGALTDAADRPDDGTRLQAVTTAGARLTETMNLISTEISTIRMTADGEIARRVSEVNEALTSIAGLNQEIRMHQGSGRDISGLLDERQRLIDKVSQNIPIREIPRQHGEVALYSTSGASLLEGNRAAEIGFTPVNAVSPGMTVANGALSGLTLDGLPVSTSGLRQPLGGGALGAQFAIRDSLAPEAQTRIDAVARDLYERFADPAVDPTLAVGQAGLFTDGAGAFDPADELGFAGRIAFNPAADPAAGGELWRLRSGLGALAEGPAGDATLLNRLADAMADLRAPATGGFSGGALSAAELGAELLSGVSTALQDAESDATFARFQVDIYDQQVLDQGVDTDAEMQKLLLVEQSYAANAQVLKAIDDMINVLLGI